MKLNVLLSITAGYMALLGLGFIFAPQAIGIGAVPAAAPPALIAYLRVFGGPFLGIAVLNWTARNAEPSTARTAIILGNIVGFSVGPALDVWGLLTGARRVRLHLGMADEHVCQGKLAQPSASVSRRFSAGWRAD